MRPITYTSRLLSSARRPQEPGIFDYQRRLSNGPRRNDQEQSCNETICSGVEGAIALLIINIQLEDGLYFVP